MVEGLKARVNSLAQRSGLFFNPKITDTNTPNHKTRTKIQEKECFFRTS